MRLFGDLKPSPGILFLSFTKPTDGSATDKQAWAQKSQANTSIYRLCGRGGSLLRFILCLRRLLSVRSRLILISVWPHSLIQDATWCKILCRSTTSTSKYTKLKKKKKLRRITNEYHINTWTQERHGGMACSRVWLVTSKSDIFWSQSLVCASNAWSRLECCRVLSSHNEGSGRRHRGMWGRCCREGWRGHTSGHLSNFRSLLSRTSVPPSLGYSPPPPPPRYNRHLCSTDTRRAGLCLAGTQGPCRSL